MQKDDRVSILSIRRIWIDLALTVFSIQVIVFAVLVIRHEAAKGNGPMETAQVVVVQLAAAMAVAAGTTFILFQGVDFIMFLTQLYKERLERKIQAAKVEGKAEGKVEERELWIEWNNRRLEAEGKGETFNESPPAKPKDSAKLQ
ncbi:hypothetical protein C6501_09465 [Candidatus Poribacteria bacterium]|nr:MAG: hypothetical protein C6501_09465 [Candidatus Poribacteria bacterium]